jgi:hypothetical protein
MKTQIEKSTEYNIYTFVIIALMSFIVTAAAVVAF